MTRGAIYIVEDGDDDLGQHIKTVLKKRCRVNCTYIDEYHTRIRYLTFIRYTIYERIKSKIVLNQTMTNIVTGHSGQFRWKISVTFCLVVLMFILWDRDWKII